MALTLVEEKAVEDFLEVVNRGERILGRVASQLSTKAVPESGNKYRIKGKAHRVARSGHKKADVSLDSATTKDLHESVLHRKIIDNSFLLHTPELYFGDLMRDAIFDEFSLPSRHRADFAYVSGHNQVIRITLVEIERADAAVFKFRGGRPVFDGGAKVGIKQVRVWKECFRSEVRQKALLLSIKPLLKEYPIPLFTPNDNVGRDVCIEIGYVVIAGSEKEFTESQAIVVDDLYLNEGILFMTYPMMVERVREKCRHKHILSLKTSGVKVKKSSSELAPFGKSIDDHLGVKMAGLGLNYFETHNKGMPFYPESIREIFYRSAGVCEFPNCCERVMYPEGLGGHFESVLKNFPEDFKFRGDHCNAQHYTAALCESHRSSILQGYVFSKFDARLMVEKLSWRKPYRPDLDLQITKFMSLWMEKTFKILMSLFKKSDDLDDRSKTEIGQWFRAFMSVPLGIRPYLVAVIVDDLRVNKRMDRSVEKCKNLLSLHYLMRAGLLRINLSAPLREQIEPVIFSSAKSDGAYSSAEIYTVDAFANSCDWNGHHLYR
ncbi:hypothetical protein [Pseudomonas sp. fls2-241-TYG-175]|uniref:hypothetical protein n=1 Tax=Pseudomonas sp. fls2-241-TYG-175 TaxID=3040312 RepID=UPI0025522C55|nr:hypothetical protein [Pseudomonas sp. fls2-241-TYG-175]